MWLIPTRNRPDAIKGLIAAMVRTMDFPDAAVMQDGCEYRMLWPANWHIHKSDEQLEMSGALNALFKLHPNEPWYGFMTDHARPISEGWSDELVKAAGEFGIAVADDGRNRRHPAFGWQRLTGAIVFGGELVRAVGWVWPPFVVHLFGDDVWETIGHRLGILRLVKSSRVDDLLACEGQFPKDNNNRRLFHMKHYAADDQRNFQHWHRNDVDALAERLRLRCAA